MFDLSKLTRDELLELNRRVVDRLKELDGQETADFMNDFSMGDKVSFEPLNEKRVKGVVIKKNKKTISVLDESGHRWNVPAVHLPHQNKENVVDAEWTTIR